ncbi:hypothetical protein ACHAXA_001222 [Cyclostephanos tholiformis]|uniref:Tetratricopeptide repeat protein n=1 Tax=Cyclostephanos tholiformis TaxID=382380 RepID=A0ABD3SQ28_9STRA
MIITLLMVALMPGASAFSSSSSMNPPVTTATLDDRHVVDVTAGNHDASGGTHTTTVIANRRKFMTSIASACLASSTLTPSKAEADDATTTAPASEVQVAATGDVKKLFNEGRAFEAQGNILAAQRLYLKVTNIAPRFIYGWSNLGNTLVAQGQLGEADESYSKAISLCEESLEQTDGSFGTRRCDDLYLILLNRGSVRLNNNMPKEALSDLTKSNAIRGRPDATILQNLVRNAPTIQEFSTRAIDTYSHLPHRPSFAFKARAQEINSLYTQSDRSYTTAISMTANEVNPFWLRSSMVKYQLGDSNGAMDLMKRVSNRFPEAPEVRAAYAGCYGIRARKMLHGRSFWRYPIGRGHVIQTWSI